MLRRSWPAAAVAAAVALRLAEAASTAHVSSVVGASAAGPIPSNVTRRSVDCAGVEVKSSESLMVWDPPCDDALVQACGTVGIQVTVRIAEGTKVHKYPDVLGLEPQCAPLVTVIHGDLVIKPRPGPGSTDVVAPRLQRIEVRRCSPTQSPLMTAQRCGRGRSATCKARQGRCVHVGSEGGLVEPSVTRRAPAFTSRSFRGHVPARAAHRFATLHACRVRRAVA